LIEEKKDEFPSAEKNAHSSKIKLSILLMTSGVLIAGYGELTFEMYSYFYCGLSVVCQSLYLIHIQKCSEGAEKDSIKTLYECSIMTIPFLLIYFFCSDELNNMTSMNSKFLSNNISFMLTFFVVLLSGCLLSFSQIWCTVKNDAITTSVVGILKSIIQTFFGIILFNGWKTLTFLSYVGLIVNFIFGGWYTYLKYIEKDLRRASEKLLFSTPSKSSTVNNKNQQRI